MKPKQLTIDKHAQNSFTVRRDFYPKNHNSWHYHEQLELVMIFKGSGSLYLGDTIKDFTEGTCVLIGPNLPHFWLFHDLHEDEHSASIDCIVIHFTDDFAGKELFNIPELQNIKSLIQLAERGIITQIELNHKLAFAMQNLQESESVHKFINLIQILDQISHLEHSSIVSDNYSRLNNINDEQRMRNVMDFIKDNYTSKIELAELSNEAKMTKNSFCRYFKQKTAKSPAQFINELRVAHACRLLKNTKLTLKEICYESGFNNYVSFHKIFKDKINLTPTQFKK